MKGHFPELLKEITIFLLTGQLILRLLPEGGYEKYARIIIGVIVISRLALPLLSLGGFDAQQAFADALSGYEQEFADIEEQVERAGIAEGDPVQESLLASLSEHLEDFCAQQGIRLVSAGFDEDGLLRVAVTALPQTAGENLPQSSGRDMADGVAEIEVEAVRVGDAEGGEDGTAAAGSGVSGNAAQTKDRLETLREALARELEMEPERLEVTWGGDLE